MALGSLCLECSQILNKIQIFAIATIAETQRSTFPSSQPKLLSRSLLRIGLPSTTYKKSILRRDYDDHSQVFLAGMKLVWPRGKKQLANRITHKTDKITIHPKCKIRRRVAVDNKNVDQHSGRNRSREAKARESGRGKQGLRGGPGEEQGGAAAGAW